MADPLPPPPPNPDDGKPGRPLKLKPDLIRAFSEILLEGNFRTVACQRLGVGHTTYKRWMALGRRFPEGIYGLFRSAVCEADAKAERLALRSILAAGHAEDVKHLEWWLERKYPERWGRYRGELRQLQKEVDDLKKLIGETFPVETPR
jgi:hypothetical protein